LETDELSSKAHNFNRDEAVEAEDEKSTKKTSLSLSLQSESSIFDKPALKLSKAFLFGQSERILASRLTAFNVETTANGLNCGATFSFLAGVCIET
jgi:hypothetical protein